MWGLCVAADERVWVLACVTFERQHVDVCVGDTDARFVTLCEKPGDSCDFSPEE